MAVSFAEDSRPARHCKPISSIAKRSTGSLTLYEYDGWAESPGETVSTKALMAAVRGGVARPNGVRPRGLSLVGITKKRVASVLGQDCGCDQRQEQLNEVGQMLGL